MKKVNHLEYFDFRALQNFELFFQDLERKQSKIKHLITSKDLEVLFFISIYNQKELESPITYPQIYKDLSRYFRGEQATPINICNISLYSDLELEDIKTHSELLKITSFCKENEKNIVLQNISLII